MISKVCLPFRVDTDRNGEVEKESIERDIRIAKRIARSAERNAESAERDARVDLGTIRVGRDVQRNEERER